VTERSSQRDDDRGERLAGGESGPASHSESALPTDVILDSVADGVFTVDQDWVITSFNRAAEAITGVSREDAVGSYCWEVFRANICETDCAIRRALDTGKPVVNQAVYIVRPDQKRCPISVSAAVLRGEQGDVIGGVETFRDLTVVEQLRRELLKETVFEDIISQNHEMRRIFAILPAVSESLSTVLVEGPSGSGKELVARAIHNLSARKDKPFVVVNCGAIPDTLLESELFGYKKGAFTDARRDRPGRFAVAEGGTLFLDEIGDISPAMQARLLRVLQEREYEPLGSNKTVKADVRVVAATNKHLEDLVEQGRFRDDLYYRLNVVRLTLPPLARRKEDIPLLLDHFIGRLNARKGKDIVGVSEEALAILLAHDYPGNIRELRNFIEHAFVLCPSGLIRPEHLPKEVSARNADRSERSKPQSFAELEAQFIREALARNQFNQAATARELGVHKTTLWRKMKKLGIEVPRK
jgi:PAS domain S-box-containing protein